MLYRKQAIASRFEKSWGRPRRRSRASLALALSVSALTLCLSIVLFRMWGWR